MKHDSEKICWKSTQIIERLLKNHVDILLKNTGIFGLNIKNHRDWLRIKEKHTGNHCRSLICRSQINWNTLQKQSKAQGSLVQLDWNSKICRRGMTADHRTYLETSWNILKSTDWDHQNKKKTHWEPIQNTTTRDMLSMYILGLMNSSSAAPTRNFAIWNRWSCFDVTRANLELRTSICFLGVGPKYRRRASCMDWRVIGIKIELKHWTNPKNHEHNVLLLLYNQDVNLRLRIRREDMYGSSGNIGF